MKKILKKFNSIIKNIYFWIIIILLFAVLLFAGFFAPITVGNILYQDKDAIEQNDKVIENNKEVKKNIFPPLDKEAYDNKIIFLANNPPLKVIEPKIDPKTGEVIPPPKPKPNLWPVKTVYPKDGAILPFNRIVAYYGNLYSKKMGVLGEYEESIMLDKLKNEISKWERADPNTKVIPALHYIAVVAQGTPGSDGKYRFRMPDSEIEKVLKMAEKIDAIVFLDIQVALSDVASEVPYFKKYLEMPNVHLGLDPEFAMHDGKKPGKVIGSLDASNINFAIDYLAKIVNDNNLPPKVLIVHRFTQRMVMNYKNIKTIPEVQIVMNMDGWGPKANKITTYKSFIYKEPVQFTGFKLFYKNDLKTKNSTLLTPAELLKLNPIPSYIQFQ